MHDNDVLDAHTPLEPEITPNTLHSVRKIHFPLPQHLGQYS